LIGATTFDLRLIIIGSDTKNKKPCKHGDLHGDYDWLLMRFIICLMLSFRIVFDNLLQLW